MQGEAAGTWDMDSPGFSALQQEDNVALTDHILTEPEPLFPQNNCLGEGHHGSMRSRHYSPGAQVLLLLVLGRAANQEDDRLVGRGRGQQEQSWSPQCRCHGPPCWLPLQEPPPKSWGVQSTQAVSPHPQRPAWQGLHTFPPLMLLVSLPPPGTQAGLGSTFSIHLDCPQDSWAIWGSWALTLTQATARYVRPGLPCPGRQQLEQRQQLTFVTPARKFIPKVAEQHPTARLPACLRCLGLPHTGQQCGEKGTVPLSPFKADPTRAGILLGFEQ